MYIRKSVISKAAIFVGITMLSVLSVLYCFTELAIPKIFYILAWGGCILAMVKIVSRMEEED